METIDIIIETPKGGTEKYNYDPEFKAFRFKKILPAGMSFPYDFGFVPGTSGEDGDPLDALVISEFTGFTGCVIECIIVGAILAEQTEDGKTMRNDRLLCVPAMSILYKDVKKVADLPQGLLEELKYFFITYNVAQGKEFNILEIADSHKAYKLLMENKQ